MPCPVCIIDAVIICGCRFFGIPDPVTTYFIGIITLSLAIVTLRYIKTKLLLNKAPKGSLVFITTIYSVLTLVVMKYIGMI